MAIHVTESSPLSQALALDPAVLNYIVSLNPKFSRLHNPVMRKVMTPYVTLTDVAEKADIPISELLKGIHEAAHMPFNEDGMNVLSVRLQTHKGA